MTRSLLIVCLLIGLARADETVLSPTQRLIPTEKMPDDLKRLAELGNVTVVYDSDAAFVKANRGWADFQIQEEHSFRYSTTKTTKRGQTWQIITIKKFEVDIDVTHLVRMPSTFESPEIWNNFILRHEFDHVMVGSDPRPRRLLKYLLNHLPIFELPFHLGEPPSESDINKAINEAINLRLTAVRDVMKKNNKTLDKISLHGLIPVPQRDAYFQKLYSKENLADLKFPFLNDVVKLFNTADYEKDLPHHP